MSKIFLRYVFTQSLERGKGTFRCYVVVLQADFVQGRLADDGGDDAATAVEVAPADQGVGARGDDQFVGEKAVASQLLDLAEDAGGVEEVFVHGVDVVREFVGGAGEDVPVFQAGGVVAVGELGVEVATISGDGH